MRALPPAARLGVLACALLASASLHAGSLQTADAVNASSQRFRVRTSAIEPVQSSGRYSVKARFAAEESAGELRESDGFALIGRFAKGAVICTVGGTVFKNGFEGP